MPETSGFDIATSQDPTATMKAFIRQNFSKLLGPNVALLDEPDGLDRLAVLVRSMVVAD